MSNVPDFFVVLVAAEHPIFDCRTGMMPRHPRPEIYAWLLDNVGPAFSNLPDYFNGKKVPGQWIGVPEPRDIGSWNYRFNFVDKQDAMLFKLTWV